MIVWLALRMYEDVEINGIFTTEEKAAAACSLPMDVIGPIEVDRVLPTQPWAGAYYPLAPDWKPEQGGAGG